MSLNKFITRMSGGNRRRRQHQSVSPSAPELSQGRTLLRGKRIMTKDVEGKSTLVENFEGDRILDPAFSTNQIASMPATDYQGEMSEIQAAVPRVNQKGMAELRAMEESFQKTLSEWARFHKSVVQEMSNLPEEYNNCIAKCENPKLDVDSINACKFGCNIGKYATEGNRQRNLRGGKPIAAGKFGMTDTENVAAGLDTHNGPVLKTV